jgi:hypothetical protein
MTTTSHFQVQPDYYNSIEDCNANKFIKTQTNSRYNSFTQTHFTCGDEEQFLTFKHQVYHADCGNVENQSNVFNNDDFKIWEKYENLDGIDVINTFHYIFYKFKKGIFVKILNNELKVFLPFSNAQFVNEWSHNIDFDMDIFKYIAKTEKYPFKEHKINKYKETWFANNGLIRYEYPHTESDTNVSNIKNMLEELCANRKLPDIEFFLNRRDFPILHTKGYEPYDDLWNGDVPLVSHKYDKYLPILSMNKTDDFADILIPTHEDWSRIQSKESKFFINSNRSCDNQENIVDFDMKKPIAVFRGSSTGDGFTIETNQRLKVAYLSFLNKIDENDNLPFLDAGITKWNMRIKKKKNCRTLQCLKVEELPFSLVPFLSYKEQCQYKYVIHVDGHVCAFRLSQELSMNSVILMVKSKNKIWFSDFLKPFQHYIPINEDLSDLYEKIKWCKLNDDKCKEIARNALIFYNNVLSKQSIFDYLQNTLIKLKEKMGVYYYPKHPIYKLIHEREAHLIKNQYKKYPKLTKKKVILESLPYISRCYGFLKAIQLFFFRNKNQLKTTNPELIFQNRHVLITKSKIDEFYVVNKKLCAVDKNNTHECFVGLFAINKLLKYIPNFVYTFGVNNENELVLEYNNGMKFYDYLNSEKFNFDDYLSILMQLCLCLQFSQQLFLFVHNDLTSWNIMLNFYDKPIIIDYMIEKNKIISISTKCVPTIIDYGKSHVAYKNFHYGNVNALKFSSIQDMISILITSMYHIISTRKLRKDEYINLLKLSNFFANSRFYNSTFRNARQLKTFLSYAKKHSNLIHSNKYELEMKTPMDIFYYINIQIPSHSLKFKVKSNNYIPFMNNKYYVKQLYYKMLFQKDDLESYTYCINQFTKYENKNTLQSLYKIQKYINYLSMFQDVIDCKDALLTLKNIRVNVPKPQIITRKEIELNELVFLSREKMENIKLELEHITNLNYTYRNKKFFLFLQKQYDFDFCIKEEEFVVNTETFHFLYVFQI